MGRDTWTDYILEVVDTIKFELTWNQSSTKPQQTTKLPFRYIVLWPSLALSTWLIVTKIVTQHTATKAGSPTNNRAPSMKLESCRYWHWWSTMIRNWGSSSIQLRGINWIIELHKSMYVDYNRIIEVYKSIMGFYLCFVELNNSASIMELHNLYMEHHNPFIDRHYWFWSSIIHP